MATIRDALRRLLQAAAWTTAATIGHTIRRLHRRRPRYGPRYGFGIHPEAVYITPGVRLTYADTDGLTAYIALRASTNDPVLITTAREFAAAMAARTGMAALAPAPDAADQGGPR